MPLLTLSRLYALAILLVTVSVNPLAAQPFEGCPSKEILAAFNAFASVGKPPPDTWRNWQHDSKAQQSVEPWSAFDNIQSVGVCWVSAWAIRTSDGVVLIDTLHEPHVDRLVANLGKAGINLAEIKYVLMTHGHFDHVGGAARLKPLLMNAKFVMTQAGWDEAIETARASQSTPWPWSMIPQDVVVKDGDIIQLGGNSFGVLETPGHTVGTASYTFDVKDGANLYRAITIGGLGLNAVKSSKQVEGFIATLDRLSGLVKQPNQPVTVNLTPHPFSSGLTEAHYRLLARKPGEPNLLVDPDTFLKLLAEWRTGAEQRLEIERKAGR